MSVWVQEIKKTREGEKKKKNKKKKKKKKNVTKIIKNTWRQK